MSEEKKYSLKQAHQPFAIECNGETWNLLGKSDRTPDEDEQMLFAAYASCYHWSQAGTPLHHQRGVWMLAHVCTELGMKDEALRNARRCLALTTQYEDMMADFDKAYALMALARAHAMVGNREEGAHYLTLAGAVGEVIDDEEDKKIFMDDFNTSNWFGIK